MTKWFQKYLTKTITSRHDYHTDHELTAMFVQISLVKIHTEHSLFFEGGEGGGVLLLLQYLQ